MQSFRIFLLSFIQSSSHPACTKQLLCAMHSSRCLGYSTENKHQTKTQSPLSTTMVTIYLNSMIHSHKTMCLLGGSPLVVFGCHLGAMKTPLPDYQAPFPRPHGEPSCQKHEVLSRYIYPGIAGAQPQLSLKALAL